VFSNNERAMHLHEKVAFRKFGVVPNKILRNGRSMDEVQMYVDLRGSDKSTRHARASG